MPLSTRELYLILRAKNEATSTLNSMSRDFEKARASAELMGTRAKLAHLQAEQAAARNAKAQQEYALRVMESQKATEQQALTQKRAEQATIAYATSMQQARKVTQEHQMAVLQQRQAMDQNAVAMIQNAKAQNDLNIARLRAQPGNDEQIRAIRATNQELQQQIVTTRNSIVARQGDINSVRDKINLTQEQINQAQRLGTAQRGEILAAQERVNGYQEEIRVQRDQLAQSRLDIANRQQIIDSTRREIAETERANKTRAESSARLRDAGQAAMSAGTGMVIAGTVAIAGLYNLTQAAVDYEKQTAMTKTQVRETGVTLEQLGKIGLEVAEDFGVSFESIQEGFFDIFSSTDATVPQATELLRDFAKAAVAGSVDIKTAGTTTIGVLNAWHLPLSDTTKILDTQFKTVQLGRITYEQLNNTIGRSIPSAVRAGQSFEELSGMIAFMTRAGLSAANSVTSAGRALDLFSNPKVVGRLERLGISARDTSGNFRPLSDVVIELQQKFAKLDPATRAEEIEKLFKGSGNNIQARRFWDLVLASDKGAQSFKQMVEDVSNSSGALEGAYSTMADTMAVQNEKLKNQWQVIKIELGSALFPVLLALMNHLKGLIDWFQGLSESQQKMIAWGVAIGAALTVLIGIIVVAVGAFVALSGAVAVVGAPVIAIIALIIAIGAALVVAYNKVDWFHNAVDAVFHAVAEVVKWLYNNVWKPEFEAIAAVTVWLWQNAVKPTFEAIGAAAKWLYENGIKPAFDGIATAAKWLYENGIKPSFEAMGAVAKWLYDNAIKPAFDAMNALWRNVIGPAVTWLANNIFGPYFKAMGVAVDASWAVMQVVFGLIQIAIKVVAAIVMWLYENQFKPAWAAITVITKALYDTGIKPAFEAIGTIIRFIWNTFINPVVQDLKFAFGTILPPVIRAFSTMFSTAWNDLSNAAKVPIRFVVNTVLNDGILAAYNKLADLFNVHPQNVHVASPFARGGPVWGPGTGTSDDIPAMLSNGEHVWTAEEVRKAGGHQAVARLREAALRRQALYARGGPVNSTNAIAGVGSDVTVMHGPSGGPLDWLWDQAKALLDPVGAISGLLGRFTAVPGAGVIKDVAINSGKKVADGIVDWVKSKMIPATGGDANLGGPSGNSIARILQWARMFYPGAMVSSGYRPGDPGYHGMGLAADLIGGGAPGMQAIAAGFYAMSGRLLEEIHSGGPGYFVKNGARVPASFYASEIAAHYNHVHIAANNNALMDRGGVLRPGVTSVMNGTGGAERVLSVAQTQAFEQLVALLDAQRQRSTMDGTGLAPVGGFGGGRSTNITLNVYTNEIDPRRNAMMLGMELEKVIG